ncbi:hypothetical protein C2845_PM05G02240 [Panicum miliaceum]|uniref:Uncharacterized protein n=1 Tax=Panicum miliaceum TaxID=4540 RepID=A0A3L6T270_PANMI|nr:hypothetical protein C2845_PM05G02240 [Panicum miliaceum]
MEAGGSAMVLSCAPISVSCELINATRTAGDCVIGVSAVIAGGCGARTCRTTSS